MRTRVFIDSFKTAFLLISEAYFSVKLYIFLIQFLKRATIIFSSNILQAKKAVDKFDCLLFDDFLSWK